ncbi:unnamed protein product (macronuclear) [Paramecium tetraurelia]|uniref:PH domain-containing protein n=1 Tax=Paramecium tetraurelia TaxID=5888 RepID=A0EDM8_PARTE|nr:uncharacterized protein GSPATT00025739001 [Paramecium tetraurelia]CAK93395.1 unnamed protein product [Paramecium tetraurelia]|eukprot:XP_001460792.1 hypothetical protein (macronuclear) [Paramecium tetraurelia strain d4-2]
MKQQYSVILPINAESFQKGSKFVDYLIDFDLSKQNQQKVELVSQSPVVKMYILSNYLPEFMVQLTNQKQIQIQERKTSFENCEQRIFNVVQFSGIEVAVIAKVSPSPNRAAQVIDVVAEELDYFKGYEKDVERKLRDNFGILEKSNWQRFCPNIVAINLNVEINIYQYGDESNVIAQFLTEIIRKYLLYFYKSMLLTYNVWQSMNDSELFKMNKSVLLQQQEVKLNLYQQITSLKDLQKTSYKELKKKYFKHYSNLSQSTFSTPAKQSQVSLTSSQTPTRPPQLQRKKAGMILKRGDGPIDYNWNQRYLVLDGQTLIYFKDRNDKVPRGAINLREAYISPMSTLDDREHCFYIEVEAQNNKQFYFSGETLDETEQWRDEISHATTAVVQTEKRPSFVVTNTYLLTDTLPSELSKYKILTMLDDLQQQWQFRKFRNGVKIYESPIQNKNTRNWKLYILLTIAFCIGVYLKPNWIPFFMAFLVALLSASYFKSQKAQNIRVYGRMVCDVDSTKAFRIIKNFKFKKVLDSNFVQINKIQDNKEAEFTKRAKVHFIIHPIRQKQVVTKPVIIQMNLLRYRFIINNGSSFIVDILTSENNKFNMFEAYEIQRIPKVSGKGLVNYYCEITCSRITTELEKYLYNKAENLSLISQTIDEERFHQFQQSIVSELSSAYIKQKSRSIVGFDEQMNSITQLKNGQQITSKRLEERVPGYRRFKEGGIECFNKEEIKAQDGLVLDLMRSAGRQLFEGRNIISFSLPVRIFEPRSMIERICEYWGFMPIYMEYALGQQDPLTSLGYTIGGRQKKPFNPILGETFQGSWQDGSSISIEHTSHHPPISHFYIEHFRKKYRFYGHFEYQAALRYNAVIGHQVGESVVEFSDGQRITFSMPPVKVSGLIYGARLLEWYGSIKFVDQKNNIVCDIKFSEGAGMLIGRSQKPTDYFEGTLFQHNRNQLVGMESNIGIWKRQDPAYVNKIESPLPSDCRYRTDLIELQNNNLDAAQEYKHQNQTLGKKTRLEILQRRDRKLRQDHKSSKSK